MVSLDRGHELVEPLRLGQIDGLQMLDVIESGLVNVYRDDELERTPELLLPVQRNIDFTVHVAFSLSGQSPALNDDDVLDLVNDFADFRVPLSAPGEPLRIEPGPQPL